MDFEWDEAKRRRILQERSLDFATADLFFDGRSAIHQPTAAWRGGTMENNRRDRGIVLHGGLDLARRNHSNHFDETST